MLITHLLPHLQLGCMIYLSKLKLCMEIFDAQETEKIYGNLHFPLTLVCREEIMSSVEYSGRSVETRDCREVK